MTKRTDVLIVDDDVHILTALRRVLHGEPYRTDTAENAADALRALAETEYAVIISDYRMPKMDGVTFLQAAKNLRPDSVRIILSGYADISAVVDGVNRGEIFKFVAKPWNDDELKLTIAQSLDHWHLLRKNQELARELIRSNAELRQLNEHLEQEVERRSRELFLKDKRFLLTQHILEHLPVAFIGVDENDMIAMANRTAETLWGGPHPALIGASIFRVVDMKLGQEIALLRGRGDAATLQTTIEGQAYLVHVTPLRSTGASGSDLITLIPLSPHGQRGLSQCNP